MSRSQRAADSPDAALRSIGTWRGDVFESRARQAVRNCRMSVRTLLPLLSTAQRQALEESLSASPADAELASTRWTRKAIVRQIARVTGVQVSPRGLFEQLHAAGVNVSRRARRGGVSGLTEEQLAELVTALSSAEQGVRWSRAKVSQWILDRYSIRYAASSVPKLLGRAGIRSLRAATGRRTVGMSATLTHDGESPRMQCSPFTGGALAPSPRT